MDMKKRGSFEELSAVTFNGECVDIPNQVMRKPEPFEEQNQMNDNSICFVSNYKFLTDPIQEWSAKIKAVCHPYSYKGARVFPKDKRLYLLSESDFSDEISLPVEKFRKKKKKYDFSYFTYDSRQGMKCKGLFILPLIMEVARKQKLKGIVVDYYPTDVEKRQHDDAQLGSHGQHLRLVRKSIEKKLRKSNIRIDRGKKPIEEVLEILYRSRFVIFPNTHDASPRLLTEALILGVPIMVNRCIDGGWKYVNNTNGLLCNFGLHYGDILRNGKRFYRRISRSLYQMQKKNFDSRQIKIDYYSKYGLFNASAALARVVNDIEGKVKYGYVFYREYKQYFDNKDNSDED